MANKSIYAIAVLTSVVAAGTWWLYGINNGQPKIDVGNLSGKSQSDGVMNSQEHQQVLQTEDAGRSNVADLHVAGEERVGAVSKNNTVHSTSHSSDLNQNSNPNSRASESQINFLSIPEGAPFPISASIEAECARLETKRIGCTDARKVLKKIEEERIDIHWAAEMENRIRVAYGQDRGIRIRALACRSSVCAVESEGSNVLSPIWGPLSDDLFPEDNIRAYEDVEGRGTLGVSLLVFTRQK